MKIDENQKNEKVKPNNKIRIIKLSIDIMLNF
jgi:hypothetical protein